jgi:hypothetical protein
MKSAPDISIRSENNILPLSKRRRLLAASSASLASNAIDQPANE